jgi:hypothetical protein
MQEILSTDTCMTNEVSIFDLTQDIMFKKQFVLIDELDFRLGKLKTTDDVLETIRLKIYYIYYFMLDDKEKEYFTHIKNFIILSNNDLIKRIKNTTVEGFFDEDENTIEEMCLNKLFLVLLKEYAPELRYTDYKDDVLSNMNKYIYLLNATYFDDFSLFQDNVLYGICIGNSVVDYKKFLTPAEWDRFQYSIYHLFYSIQEFPTDDEILDIEKNIESKVDLLYVK